VMGSLPHGWQFMSIAELAKAKKAGNRWWTNLDTPILVRAISILLVVAGHMRLVPYGGGAVAGLMLISGYMLGSLQLREAFARGNASPILQSIGNVVLPTAIISLFIAWIRWRGEMFESYILTFSADLQDFRALGVNQGWDAYLWYVHCLIHMMIFLYFAAVAIKAVGWLRGGMRPVLFGLFALGCIGRFVVPVAMDPGILERGVRAFDRAQYLPTTHFATLMLGALIATSANVRERLQVLAISAAYVLASAWLFRDHRAYFIAGAVLLLLALPRIPLPRVFVRVIFPLSGASLFIYLCQYIFPMMLKHVGVARTPLTSTAAALLGGMALWLVWSSRGVFVRWMRSNFRIWPRPVEA